MLYKVAADSIVLIHFLWILFLIFGAYVGRTYRIVKICHIAGLAFSVLMQIFGWYCPLTHLEIWLRRKHDPLLAYTGSFIMYYVEKIVYLQLSPVIIFVLTLLLVSVSMYIYGARRGKRLPRRPGSVRDSSQ
jgi:hypothetical protein